MKSQLQRDSGRQQRHVAARPLLASILFSLLLWCAFAHQAQAHGRGSGNEVLAHRFLRASRGGVVKAKNGVSILVPSGTMTRSGRVSITRIHRGIFDVHIAAPWHGTVAVTLPVKAHSQDTILHKIGSLWMTEGQRRNLRTVWVTQLSWFGTTVGNAIDKLRDKYCLSFNADELIQCLESKAADKIDQKLLTWVEARLPQSCATELAEAEFNGYALAGGSNAVRIKAAMIALLKQAAAGACQGQAGEYYHVPTGPTTGTAPRPGAPPGVSGGGSGGSAPISGSGPSGPGDYSVTNASGGIYWRSGPDWNSAEATPGNGFYPGTVIHVICYQSGAANVPGTTDSMWEQAQWVSGPGTGSGWINEHFINDGVAINQPSPGAGPCNASAPPTQQTWSETAGGVSHTWTNYTNAGGTEGPSIAGGQTVQIACRLQGFRVADGNTWWYRIASGPWSNNYYVSADAFYNNGQTSGSLLGTPFVDTAVTGC